MPDNRNKSLDQDKKQQQEPMKQEDKELDKEDEITERNPRQGGAMPKNQPE